MKNPIQEIKKLSELLNLTLTIPHYQRPYKWKSENVGLLLDDIFEHVINKENAYRIGSIILHKDQQGKLNIVDGQQRLTSISILLKYLGETDSLLLNQNYKEKISKDNIVYNAKFISNWIGSKGANVIISFKNAILERCEFVVFTVFEQDEAFQLFDSQNARGKSLEPYDLLKAFHLREMDDDTEEDKSKCIATWEKSIDNHTLKPILDEHLFKIRKWFKNENKYEFRKEDIAEFKGVSLHHQQIYPYESAARILDGFVANAQQDKFLKNSHIAQQYPFSITMPIINGKRFFEYVEHYINFNKDIFSEKDNPKFYRFYEIYCLGIRQNDYGEKYKGAWRVGDIKVRNLYENILLLFMDKFGNKEFDKFYEAFYKAVYAIRCDNKSIRLETILKSQQRNILQEINNNGNTEKLKRYQYNSDIVTKTDEELVSGITIIKNFINNELSK